MADPQGQLRQVVHGLAPAYDVVVLHQVEHLIDALNQLPVGLLFDLHLPVVVQIGDVHLLAELHQLGHVPHVAHRAAESSVRAVDRGEGDEEKPLGVGLVLDEFGAGFPALEHLQHHPRDGKPLLDKLVDVVPLDLFIRKPGHFTVSPVVVDNISGFVRIGEAVGGRVHDSRQDLRIH